MAEKYGVKPKIFTKDWWPYFWMYYKWHTIVLGVLVLFLTAGITDYVTRTIYDLELTYYGTVCGENSQWAELCDLLEPNLADIDSNGEINLGPTVLNKSEETTMYEHNQTMHVGFMDSFSDENMYLYILDKEILENLASNNFLPDFFVETEIWLQTELSSDMIISTKDGKPYAVSLKNSKKAKMAGLACDDLYVLVKRNTDKNEPNKDIFENAIIAANNLIK